VPAGTPMSCEFNSLPSSISSVKPVFASCGFVVINISDTDAIEGNASPLKPRVWILSKSVISEILLVECLSIDNTASSFDIPQPSSETDISSLPLFFILTGIFFAPESKEFSTSSFTTEAGRSITSPAAILFTISNGRIFILFIRFAQFFPFVNFFQSIFR